MIDISIPKKSEVLAALYNHAKPQGLGFRWFNPALGAAARALGLSANLETDLLGKCA